MPYRDNLTRYDHLHPAEAARLAWGKPGAYPRYHSLMKDEVRKRMPLLARALDRLEEEL